MSIRMVSLMRGAMRLAAPFAAVMMLLPVAAHAQFSDSYKFLEAVRKRDGAEVEKALSEPGTAIINTRDVTSGQSALHIVTARRDLTWLQFLLAKGANANIRDDRGQTPLQTATSLGWRDGVAALLSQKAEPDVANDAGETPLITATHRRDTTLMQLLLEAGADPGRADNSGRTARDYAAQDGSSSQLTTTIDKYAKKNASSSNKPVYGPSF